MIFVLDNYDSFTYNLVHMLHASKDEIMVRRNDETTPGAILNLHPRLIVLSPGPGRPEDAGIMPELIRRAAGSVPLFGVCLGHQAIGQVFGGEVVQAKHIMHGKISPVTHDGRGIFTGSPSPFKAVRYHSLALRESSLPPELEVSARSDDGEVMAIRHKTLPIESVQYHVESLLTAAGRIQLGRVLDIAHDFARKGGAAC